MKSIIAVVDDAVFCKALKWNSPAGLFIITPELSLGQVNLTVR